MGGVKSTRGFTPCRATLILLALRDGVMGLAMSFSVWIERTAAPILMPLNHRGFAESRWVEMLRFLPRVHSTPGRIQRRTVRVESLKRLSPPSRVRPCD